MDSKTLSVYFTLFNEIGIIEQLSRALFETRLPNGFLISHFSVLNSLIRVRDGRTPLELARAFQVPKTTMTHTLSGLEKGDFIVMRPNPKDGRSKCVWLTDSGRAFRDAAIGNMVPDMMYLAERCPIESLDGVIEKLSEIRQIMDAKRDEDPA